jgi:hypothetical protein
VRLAALVYHAAVDRQPVPIAEVSMLKAYCGEVVNEVLVCGILTGASVIDGDIERMATFVYAIGGGRRTAGGSGETLGAVRPEAGNDVLSSRNGITQ